MFGIKSLDSDHKPTLPEIAAGYCVWASSSTIGGATFDQLFLRGLTNIKAEVGRLTCELPVGEHLVNKKLALHGGVTASIVDVIGHAGCITVDPCPGGWTLGLTVHYLTPAPIHHVLLIDARVVGVSGEVITTEVYISDVENKKHPRLVAYGTNSHAMAPGDNSLGDNPFEPLAQLCPKGLQPPDPIEYQQVVAKLGFSSKPHTTKRAYPQRHIQTKTMGSPEAAKGFLLYSTTQHTDNNTSPKIFDTTALIGLKDIQATPGRVTAVLPVHKRVQNRYGTLHGGAIATLIDVVGTAALLTVGQKGGVSLAINSNYLSPMPGGGEVLIDAKLIRTGRTVATIGVELRNKATNEMVAQGTHVKFISSTEPDLSVLEKAAGLTPLEPYDDARPRSKL